jgi:hypothetical protein
LVAHRLVLTDRLSWSRYAGFQRALKNFAIGLWITLSRGHMGSVFVIP